MNYRIQPRRDGLQARHGLSRPRSCSAQPFEVDVDLQLDPPARRAADDSRGPSTMAGLRHLPRTCRVDQLRPSRGPRRAIAHELLADFAVVAVTVRVRKTQVHLGVSRARRGRGNRRRRTG